ncbi:Transcriptional regulator, GntR family domain / Aspartate aminotransferase [Anopheles sinensis]|uniref:Transcriptional regulator, GntR family domain / Aspartate aminotransferase n=1 Tax=Anopheles sinensis TaxID=74873 RepID=A0A084WBP1_ANOSI|nr:Transcriptional regulator, GntR family domain / Aspartate aminotransferase [Anopheles sinensis]
MGYQISFVGFPFDILAIPCGKLPVEAGSSSRDGTSSHNRLPNERTLEQPKRLNRLRLASRLQLEHGFAGSRAHSSATACGLVCEGFRLPRKGTGTERK